MHQTKERTLFTDSDDYRKQAVLVGEPYGGSSSCHEDGVELRSGESTRKVRARRKKEEVDRTKWTDVDCAINWFKVSLIKKGDSYSETFILKENGKFDEHHRVDGEPTSILPNIIDNPEGFYELAKKVEELRPDWHFTFNDDRSLLRFKYTVVQS